jgi:hypothetical protein
MVVLARLNSRTIIVKTIIDLLCHAVNNEIKTGLWFNTRRQILSPLSQIIQSKDKNRTRQKILYAVKFRLIITLRMVHEVQLRSLNVYDNNKGNMTESIRYLVNSLDLQGGQIVRYLSLKCANSHDIQS